MNEDTITRTDRRRARTRQDLISAARELIAEKGVSGLRIGAITERADVALGSFYNYFASKEEVVEAIVAETIRGLAESLGDFIASVEDPAEAVSVSARRVIRLATEDEQLGRLLVNLDRSEERFEGMVLPQARAALERGAASGRFDIPDMGVMLSSIVGSALSVMRGVLEGRLSADAEIAATEGILRQLGLERAQAHEVATRELPEIDS